MLTNLCCEYWKVSLADFHRSFRKSPTSFVSDYFAPSTQLLCSLTKGGSPSTQCILFVLYTGVILHHYIAPLAQKTKYTQRSSGSCAWLSLSSQLIFFRNRSSVGALEVLVGDGLREEAQRAHDLGVLLLLKRLEANHVLCLKL